MILWLLGLHLCTASSAALPLRLSINGSMLIDPTTTQPIRLTGFNWQSARTGSDPGALMRQLVPGANVARLVGIQWGNTHPLQKHPNKECMTNTPPHFFNDKCFEDLDPWVKSATDAGLWVVLAVRGEYIAGQLFSSEPGSVVFRNESLRSMMYAMWRYVAAHYANHTRIAAYEILSEPRDKEISAAIVRSFYEEACAAVQEVDPRTPCMVGSAPYYKLWTFGEQTLLRNNTNVIYTFDYFNPDAFVFGSASIASYNSSYPCATLYQGWADEVCPTWSVSKETQITFDKSWHDHNLRTFAKSLRDTHHVPLFMNQFEVVHGVSAASGRFHYVEDVLAVAKLLDIGWAWWTWSGGNSEGWSHGSSEIVFHWPNGSIMVDTSMLDTMKPYFAEGQPLLEVVV